MESWRPHKQFSFRVTLALDEKLLLKFRLLLRSSASGNLLFYFTTSLHVLDGTN